jgi:hypothetical protein
MFDEAYYEELDAEQRYFFDKHLLVCPKCKSGFAEMASTLKVMAKKIRPEPGQTFWDDYWNRLENRMKEEKSDQPKPEPRWRTFPRTLSFAPRWAFQAAAALLLVVFGVFIGKTVFSPSAQVIQQARQESGYVSQQQPGAELIRRTQNYIERSKLILLAIVNFDPKTEDPYGLNFPYQQQISRQLVKEAAFIRDGLADSNQRRLQGLITDLEVILLQIANLESGQDFDALELVKEGVDSRGILLKINLTDIRRSMQPKDRAMPDGRPSNKFRTY